MSRLFRTLRAGSHLSSSHPMDPDSPEQALLQNNKEGALDERLSEQCELRIEGMTCGSCVEVRSN
jgi:Cu+-exporting ATPase